MTHPSGAGYRHTPAFVDRMKRAEGGEVQPAADGSDAEMARASKYPNKVPGISDADIDANNARGDALERMTGRSRFEGNAMRPVPMPTVSGVDTGDNIDADTSANTPGFMKGLTPK